MSSSVCHHDWKIDILKKNVRPRRFKNQFSPAKIPPLKGKGSSSNHHFLRGTRSLFWACQLNINWQHKQFNHQKSKKKRPSMKKLLKENQPRLKRPGQFHVEAHKVADPGTPKHPGTPGAPGWEIACNKRCIHRCMSYLI